MVNRSTNLGQNQVSSLLPSQPTIADIFHATSKKNYPSKSSRAAHLNEMVARFIVKGLRPYSIVDSPEFRALIYSLDPRYKLPSRTTFAERIIPQMYQAVKRTVMESLAEATQGALTTDGWTSCATDSYITITSCHLTVNWEIINFVLQTRVLNESHTAENLADVMNEAVQEWKLPTTFGFPPVTTDNAANVIKAAVLSQSILHVPCLAHTINLAVQKVLHIKRVSHVLAKIRRIAAFFHRSPRASAMLKDKAILLSLPCHDLIIDVATRWNSAYDMVSRYLEMQCGVVTVLMHKDMVKCKGDLPVLSDDDTTLAEELVNVLKPMKDMTTMLCSENSPTVSIIMPLKHHLMNVVLLPKEDDSPVVSEIKRTMADNFGGRYEKQAEMLSVASAIDPRFKNLPFLSDEERYVVFGNVTAQTAHVTETMKKKVAVKAETDTSDSQVMPPLPNLPGILQDDPAFRAQVKKESENGSTSGSDSAGSVKGSPDSKPVYSDTKPANLLEGLLGDVFVVQFEPSKSPFELAKLDVDQYCNEPSIPLSQNCLQWWKINEDKYPRLAQLARTLLCIPATSVPSERAFSTAGDILTHQRSSMRPENVDILLFLKKNLK